ncbi:MAG: hypothetical protein WCL19_07790 [Verrucomicrobiota bacterium]
MKTPVWLAVSFAVLALASPLHALTVDHQISGSVLEISDTKIVIQKGRGEWEITRNSATKVTGDLKVGANVTIQYTMTATAIEVKPAGSAPTEKKKP